MSAHGVAAGGGLDHYLQVAGPGPGVVQDDAGAVLSSIAMSRAPKAGSGDPSPGAPVASEANSRSARGSITLQSEAIGGPAAQRRLGPLLAPALTELEVGRIE